MAAYRLPSTTAAKLKEPWEKLKVLQAGSAYRPAAAVYMDENTVELHGTNFHNVRNDDAESNSTQCGSGSPDKEVSSEQEGAMWVKAIYRGLIPAKNILNRDFAIAGTLVRLITFSHFGAAFAVFVSCPCYAMHYLSHQPLDFISNAS